MRIDTSSYYPKSPLDDDSEPSEEKKAGSLFPETVHHEGAHAVRETTGEPDENANMPASPGNRSMADVLLDAAATAFSWLFVPLLAPVYGIMLIFGLSVLSLTPMSVRVIYTLEVAAINLVIPAILIYLLKRFGVVEDLGLNGRKERTIPYIVTICCMGGTGALMLLKGAQLWVAMFFFAGGIAAIINLLINFRWKISAHAAAIAGLPALLVRIMHVGVCQPETVGWLMVTIIVAGLLGSARIWLGRHTLMQVMAGYAVGFFTVFFLTMI